MGASVVEGVGGTPRVCRGGRRAVPRVDGADVAEPGPGPSLAPSPPVTQWVNRALLTSLSRFSPIRCNQIG